MADTYQDRHNRHTVYLERLATHLYNEHLTTSLDAAYKAARLILLDAESITSLTQLNRITAAVKASTNPVISEGWALTTGELEDTAIYEAGYYSDMFGDANDVTLAVPTDKKITSSATNSLMTLTSGQNVQSNVWSAFVATNTNSVIERYNGQIRAGFSGNESVSQIVKRLRTITDGLLKRNAEALARTGMNHYATKSRETLMQANKHLVPNKYFNSVFDNRRSLICSSYSAKPLFAIDDPNAPTFPLHYNERSNWLYLVEGQTAPIGTRAAVGGKHTEGAEENYERRKNALSKRRANENITGTTSSKVKYRGKRDSETFKAGQISGTAGEEWYRSQPLWYLESNMGKSRAALFKSGQINLDGLVDQYGKPLTLKQLIGSGV